MRKQLLFTLTGFLVAFCVLCAENVIPPGTISFQGVEMLQALDVYIELSGLDLVVDSRVRTVRHQIWLVTPARSKDEEKTIVEKALLLQAGVVITRLDDKRVSVTYNDALPIIEPKKTPTK